VRRNLRNQEEENKLEKKNCVKICQICIDVKMYRDSGALFIFLCVHKNKNRGGKSEAAAAVKLL